MRCCTIFAILSLKVSVDPFSSNRYSDRQSTIDWSDGADILRFQRNSRGAEENFLEGRVPLVKGDSEKNGVRIQSPVPGVKRFGDMVEAIFQSQCGLPADIKEHAGTCMNNS